MKTLFYVQINLLVFFQFTIVESNILFRVNQIHYHLDW